VSGWLVALVLVAASVAGYQLVKAIGRSHFGPRWDAAYWLAVAWLALLAAASLAAPVLPLAEGSNASRALAEPIMARPALDAHVLGTNNLGLDLLTRVIAGARLSLLISVGGVLLGMVVGGALGMLAGYLKGAADVATRIPVNALLAFPPLILMLALASVLTPDARNLVLVFGLVLVPVNYRLARASTIAFSQRDFVTAARTMGARRIEVLGRELLPNVALPIASYALVLIPLMVVAEAALGFLGLGVPPPQPSWGNMIAEGQGGVFEANPHIVLVPGIALFLTVLSLNLVGERVRSRWERQEVQV
jgi:peptide/nickel transport system permease protein